MQFAPIGVECKCGIINFVHIPSQHDVAKDRKEFENEMDSRWEDFEEEMRTRREEIADTKLKSISRFRKRRMHLKKK